MQMHSLGCGCSWAENAVKMIQYEGVDSVLHWFVLLRAAQKLEIEFCLQDMSASLAFLAVGQHE